MKHVFFSYLNKATAITRAKIGREKERQKKLATTGSLDIIYVEFKGKVNMDLGRESREAIYNPTKKEIWTMCIKQETTIYE